MTWLKLKNKFKLPPVWHQLKYWFGYSLFVVTITYGLWHAPAEVLQVQPVWLLCTIAVTVVIFMLQQWQVRVFLHYHQVEIDWFYPALFTARKGVLNTVLPAKSGTLILLNLLAERYQLKWYDFVIFMLVSSVASLLISLIGAVWVLLPLIYTLLLLLLIMIATYIARQYSPFPYARCFPLLLVIASGLYFSTIMVFFFLLRGIGFELTLIDVSYFAIVLNMLAQFAFTPGNVGVREVVIGLISPYVALPISVGILASAIFYVIRLSVYAMILGGLEWLNKDRLKT